MAVFDLFSKRQKALRGDMRDMYVYDVLPQPLRVQIVHILNDAIGGSQEYGETYHARHKQTFGAYKFIVETLCREYGTFILPNTEQNPFQVRDYLSELANFLLKERDVERALDAIDLAFRYIDRIIRPERGPKWADDAISELNIRFREHGIGYEYTNDELIRIDSQLLHSEAVKPALRLLSDTPEYAGAQAEFLTAFEHYRRGRKKEAIGEALKALESVMKAICTKRKWPFDASAQAKGLIDVIFAHNLIPAFLTSHFSALRSTLESGVPTMRNKLPAAHGQGVAVVDVPEHLVAYILHLTASAIVLLTEAERALP